MDDRSAVSGPEDLERFVAYVANLATERFTLVEILDAIPMAVGIIDDQGRARIANQRWNEYVPQLVPSLDPEHTHRWRAVSASGEPLPPDEWPGAQALRGRAVSGAHMLYTGENGRERWMRVTASPVLDDEGRIFEAVCTVEDVDAAKRAEESLRRSQRTLVDHLLAARKLRETSIQLIEAGDIEALYDRILEAASAIMQTDLITLQRLDETNRELATLRYRGFTAESVSTWLRVQCDTAATPCAAAMRAGQRFMAHDLQEVDFMVGTADLESLLAAGVRSSQSTPLYTRDGRIVGMISTHWRAPHTPSRLALASLDVLARQAADLVERTVAEEQRALLLASLEEERRLVHELPAHAMPVEERVILVPLVGSVHEDNMINFARGVLRAVRRQRARAVVLDLTGVEHVDDEATDWVVKLSNAVRIMGSEVVAAGFDTGFLGWRAAFRFETDGLVIASDVREGIEMARSICV